MERKLNSVLTCIFKTLDSVKLEINRNIKGVIKIYTAFTDVNDSKNLACDFLKLNFVTLLFKFHIASNDRYNV